MCRPGVQGSGLYPRQISPRGTAGRCHTASIDYSRGSNQRGTDRTKIVLFTLEAAATKKLQIWNSISSVRIEMIPRLLHLLLTTMRMRAQAPMTRASSLTSAYYRGNAQNYSARLNSDADSMIRLLPLTQLQITIFKGILDALIPHRPSTIVVDDDNWSRNHYSARLNSDADSMIRLLQLTQSYYLLRNFGRRPYRTGPLQL